MSDTLTMLEVFREFHFDAAHRLENLPEGHKCARVHGHTYRLTVYVAGEVDPVMGWIVDFADLKRITQGVVGQLDHRMLNDVPGLEQPTTESVIVWIWDRLKPDLPHLSRLRLWENATSGCEYTGRLR
ncbi:MAG: 6-carboxytetrahydropterin synthase QueD [Phycisphaera sp.]|nr:MAG: 6-carboxytetrahydropterin synthase QueD [Phycisphaera sp.]